MIVSYFNEKVRCSDTIIKNKNFYDNFDHIFGCTLMMDIKYPKKQGLVIVSITNSCGVSAETSFNNLSTYAEFYVTTSDSKIQTNIMDNISKKSFNSLKSNKYIDFRKYGSQN